MHPEGLIGYNENLQKEQPDFSGKFDRPLSNAKGRAGMCRHSWGVCCTQNHVLAHLCVVARAQKLGDAVNYIISG